MIQPLPRPERVDTTINPPPPTHTHIPLPRGLIQEFPLPLLRRKEFFAADNC